MSADVRLANESDVKALAKLANELIPMEDQKRREACLKDSIKDPKRDIYVVEIEGRLAGFLELYTFPDFVHGGEISLIQNLAIAREYRGLGLGDELLARAVKRAGERGALELHAWTGVDNKPAISLYKKYGMAKEYLLLEKELQKGK